MYDTLPTELRMLALGLPAVPTPEDLFFALYGQEISRCICGGGELLYDLAHVPDSSKGQFLEGMARVLYEALVWQNIIIRKDPEAVHAIERFETALRAAYNAFLQIPEDWREVLTTLPGPGSTKMPWDRALQSMLRKCSDHTGRSPIVTPQRGRGRRKGDATKDTYPFRDFIWNVARSVRQHGGHLTLYAREQRGTWIDALNGLRPLFLEGFIPRVLPLSMIEEVQAKANKLPL
jgi:hypothetical protein